MRPCELFLIVCLALGVRVAAADDAATLEAREGKHFQLACDAAANANSEEVLHGH